MLLKPLLAAFCFHDEIIMLKNFNTKFSSRVAVGMEISCIFATLNLLKINSYVKTHKRDADSIREGCPQIPGKDEGKTDGNARTKRKKNCQLRNGDANV